MAHALRFLMVGGGKAVCRAMGVLVQHMAVKVSDKAEIRREAGPCLLVDSRISQCLSGNQLSRFWEIPSKLLVP